MQANFSGVLVGRHQRRIADVAAAEEAHPLRLGDALGDGPIERVDQVVMHAAAPFVVGGGHEGFAKAGRAPVIDAQHRIAAVCAIGGSG